MAAKISVVADERAAVLLKRCSGYFAPPITNDKPSTNKMLPIIEPVIEALTTP